MKTKDQFNQELAHLCDLAVANSIWRPASVTQEPETNLTQWRVYTVTNAGVTTTHFVGYAGYEGRVCSAVQTYDPTTKRGITKSGRIYELIGSSGFDGDAMYVFDAWCSRFPKDTSFVDITKEYE